MKGRKNHRLVTILIGATSFALAACSSINISSVQPIACEPGDPLRLSTFVNNWNAQTPDSQLWALTFEEGPESTKPYKVRHCSSRNEEICFDITLTGNCIVTAEVIAQDADVNSMRGLSIDLQRRIVWSKLIRSLDPGISEEDQNKIDTELYANLPYKATKASTHGTTNNTSYRATKKGGVLSLVATPIRREIPEVD